MYLWDHIRHRSGFAVHSPFMYGVVRKAMMPRKVVGTSRELYDALGVTGASRRTATRLQNYLTHLDYPAWSVDKSVEQGLVVATPKCSAEEVEALVAELSDGRSATLCLLHGRSKVRKALAKRLVAQHPSMSASKCDFTLLVYGRALPKQHIIL